MNFLLRYSLEELVDRCRVRSELILTFVEKAWISPVDKEKMIFDEEDAARVRLIYELQHVMGINDEGVPVVLHLVDQLNRMHIEVGVHLRKVSG